MEQPAQVCKRFEDILQEKARMSDQVNKIVMAIEMT